MWVSSVAHLQPFPKMGTRRCEPHREQVDRSPSRRRSASSHASEGAPLSPSWGNWDQWCAPRPWSRGKLLRNRKLCDGYLCIEHQRCPYQWGGWLERTNVWNGLPTAARLGNGGVEVVLTPLTCRRQWRPSSGNNRDARSRSQQQRARLAHVGPLQPRALSAPRTSLQQAQCSQWRELKSGCCWRQKNGRAGGAGQLAGEIALSFSCLGHGGAIIIPPTTQTTQRGLRIRSTKNGNLLLTRECDGDRDDGRKSGGVSRRVQPPRSDSRCHSLQPTAYSLQASRLLFSCSSCSLAWVPAWVMGNRGTTCCHLQRACRGRWAFVSTGSSSQAWLLPGSPNTRERTRSSAVARVLEPKPLVDHRWRLERYKGRLDPWLPTPPVAKIRDQAACPIRSHPRPLLAPVIEFLIGQLLLVLPSSRALSLAIQSNATDPCQRFCHALGPQSHQQFLCSPRCTSHRGTPVSSSFSASKASKELAPCFLCRQGGKRHLSAIASVFGL